MALAKIVKFGGKRENWVVWCNKFLERGRRKRQEKIVLGEVTVPKEGKEFEGDEAEKKMHWAT